MASIRETAYPRFKTTINLKDLDTLFTPTQDEILLAQQNTKSAFNKFCFILMLKSFQKLGYFITISEIPPVIMQHISNKLKVNISIRKQNKYDSSRTRLYHLAAIRKQLKVKPFGKEGRHIIVKTISEIALTKDENIDLINAAIEELIRQNYELPVFNTLSSAASRIKKIIYRSYYKTINTYLNDVQRNKIDSILEKEENNQYSPWNKIKQDPLSPTITHLKELVAHLGWLKELNISNKSIDSIPYVKIRQFALEAKTLNAAQIKQVEPSKRYSLVFCLIYIQTANTIDDLAEMLIKRMMLIHRKGKDALERYRKERTNITDKLIITLKDVINAYQKEGTAEEKFSAIDAVLSSKSENVLENCEAHVAHIGNNYYSFLWNYYKSHRTVFFDILKHIKLFSTNQDDSLQESCIFLKNNENRRADFLEIVKIENKGKESETKIQLLKLNWIPDVWWKIITGKNNRNEYPEKIDRRHFEVCFFTQVMWELKSGDLYIEGGDKYSDFREQLISWENYEKNKKLFGEQVNLPVESSGFVKMLREMLNKSISEIDNSFPDNKYVKIVKNEPVISKLEKIKYPEQKYKIDELIAKRLNHINILDVITDTEHWLNWTKHFGLISGHESKIDNPKVRYLLSAFCYGCNLGPTQTVRSLEELSRKHLSWVNQHHITEDKIDKAIFHIINAYNSLLLPKYWGDGKSASTDGTQIDLYDLNLFSEYHIRYGGYGGIGYYLVSDKYIALFSHFIPCGAWEGNYLLDVLQGNKSEIQPDTVHGDTQSQNAPIFGLSFLLGINIMPRIRNWKDLILYRSNENQKYKHIDELFSGTINWNLIETYFPDMLRVALSIKEGKIKPSAILNKLGTYSRKNKLYQAFRELGRVTRTIYLMKYIGSAELRSTIQSATNKSEAYNNFSKWIAFGNNGIIRENVRDEQRKIIKYNQLVSNCLIFYNTCMLTHIIEDLISEGYTIEDATLSSLSPFLTNHINRFGKYKLDLERKPIEIKYDISGLENKFKK